LTPVRCLGEGDSQLPSKATQEVSRDLLSLLKQKSMPKQIYPNHYGMLT
jgi:hypothetical protein